MDEIKLFTELQPPPPPDAPRMREAARARLTAATSGSRVHPGRRRATLVSVAAAAALVAGGTAYGLTAAQSGASLAGGSSRPGIEAGLTTVRGCPGIYVTAGTLTELSGAQLIIKPANDTDHVNRVWRAQPVTVATTGSTAITAPATGTLSDITNGSRVRVVGTWSGSKLAATQVSLVTGMPPLESFGPVFNGHPGRLRRIGPEGLRLPAANGTVVDVYNGGFTVLDPDPALGDHRVQVITSNSTMVQGYTRASLSQLNLGANVVAVGTIGRGGVMAAVSVAESRAGLVILAGGPVKIRTTGCSASAITTAVILAAS